MRILAFSDPHISPKSSFSKPTLDGLTTYLSQIKSSFNFIKSVAETSKPEFILCLGDVTDTPGFIDTLSLEVASEVFEGLRSICKVFVLVGNHDIYSYDCNHHNLSFLNGYENVSVIDKPTLVDNLFFQPWMSKGEELRIPDKARVVFSHMDILGSPTYKGIESEIGVDPKDLHDLYVINGHMHVRSTLKNSIYNVGSLLSRNFKDVNSTTKGVTIFDINEEGKITSSDFLENPNDIKFVEIIIENKDQAKYLELKLSKETDSLSNCYVKFYHSKEFTDLSKRVESLSKGLVSVSVEPSRSYVIPKFTEDVFSPSELFTEYITLSESRLNKEEVPKILEIGLDYIDRSSNEAGKLVSPISFESIDIEYFQPLGKIFFDLSICGLWYVTGRNEDELYVENATGKSSIADSIYWCLTGESLKGCQVDDIAHWDYGYCKVVLKFSILSSTYKLMRTRGDSEYGNSVHIWGISKGEEVEISARTRRDVDHQISFLLGRSKQVLKHSVFLTSDMLSKFTSLSCPDRVKIIEDIVDLSVFSNSYKLANADYYKLEVELDSKTTQESYLKTQVEISNRKIKLLKEEMDKERDSLSERLLEIENRISVANNNLGGEESELKEILNSIRELDGILYRIDENINKLSNLFISYTSKSSSIRTKIKSNESIIKTNNSLVDAGKCTLCGQKVDKSVPIFEFTEVMKLEVKELSESLDKANRELLSVEKGMKDLKEDLKNNKVKRSVMINKKDGISNTINYTKSTIQKLKHDKELELVKSNNLGVQYNLEVEKLNSLNKDISFLSCDILSLKNKMSTLSKVRDSFSTEGVRSYLIFSVAIPYINSRIEKYSNILGRKCSLSYKEKKCGEVEDKIDIVIPGRKSYKSMSRGEKVMVDLSIQCALNDLATNSRGSKVNLLVCDEVVDSIGDTTLKSFVEILRERSKDTTVFLMAHRSLLSEIIDNKVFLVKKDGVVNLESIC